MFSLKSALTWGIGLALGVGLVAGLHPDVRDYLSQALVKAEARVESSLGLAGQSSAAVSTGSPAHPETGSETETLLQTGVQAQTGVGVNVSTGNTSAMTGTETEVNAGAEVKSQSDWSLKNIFYKLTHGAYSLYAQADVETEASAEAHP